MPLHPLTHLAKCIRGSLPLPAGAVPLAQEGIAGHICLMPIGRWINWQAGVIESRPRETQKAVMDVVISQLGGTAASAGTALDVSPRTVEAWRSGKAPLPIKCAYAIACALASH